ncbi:MAG: ester cyclase [Acidimicrobiia bacterium]
MSGNAAVAKRLVTEVVNQGRMETITQVIHPDYRYHGPGGVEVEGPEGARQLIGGFRAAFSDLHAQITSEIAQGDLVALTMVATGTHDGDLMGIAPTGASIELPMAVVSRLEDGRIAEEWEYYDTASLMSQLDAEPTSSVRPTLVLCASGKTGRRVVDRLTAAGHSVKAASRSGETRFDWEDQSTWAPALAGVGAVYIVYYPDLAFPGAADTVGEFADLAVAMGVKRLVLLSGRGEEGARQAELRVEDSGADWTLVRCAFFNQNFSEIFADAVRYGSLVMPGDDIAEPFLDADDIADVVVAALTDDRHIGKLYELTGPRLLTLAEAAADLSAALDREVEYIPVTAKEFAAALVDHGIPDPEAMAFAELIAEVLDGRNSYLTAGVQQALGRPPREFADWARGAAATGVWDLVELPA